MAFLAVIFSCLVHPYHRSLAEVQWNAESDRYEVALRVDPRDLDAALSDLHRRPVVLDRMDKSAANTMLKSYVGTHLQLRRSSGVKDQPDKIAPTHWVGFESDDRGKYVWLYFEWAPPAVVAPPADEASLWIENRLFVKTEPTHISTVVFTTVENRPSLVFTKQHPRHRLPQINAPAAQP